VWATTVCRHYLRGVHFELITDSKVVAAIIKKDVPTRRQNLLVRLFEFDFTVTHRKGELNRNADFFSRWAADKGCEDANDPQPPAQPSHGQGQTREQPIDLDRDVVGRKEEESDSFQCFATHIAADTPPMVDDADSKDKKRRSRLHFATTDDHRRAAQGSETQAHHRQAFGSSSDPDRY
jgi:hypothetical protein